MHGVHMAAGGAAARPRLRTLQAVVAIGMVCGMVGLLLVYSAFVWKGLHERRRPVGKHTLKRRWEAP